LYLSYIFIYLDDKKLKTWQKLVAMILHEISNHRFASVFQNPIREQDAPGYYDIVKQPMDLRTLKRRLREGVFNYFIKLKKFLLLNIKTPLNFFIDYPRY
jgi:hypothetical protein